MASTQFRMSARAGMFAAVAALAGCSGGSSGIVAPPQQSQSASSAIGPQLYQLSSGTATPITSPPAGTLGLKTLDLTFSATSQNQPVLVSESGYTGNFTVATSCTPSAGAPTGAVPATALFPGTTSTTAAGPNAVVTVTAGATGGTCTFTISDANATSQSAVIFAGTTLTSGSVQ